MPGISSAGTCTLCGAPGRPCQVFLRMRTALLNNTQALFECAARMGDPVSPDALAGKTGVTRAVACVEHALERAKVALTHDGEWVGG